MRGIPSSVLGSILALACGCGGASPAAKAPQQSAAGAPSSVSPPTQAKAPVARKAHPATTVTKKTIDIAPATVQIPGYLAGFAFLAAHDSGELRIGWNAERDLHIAPVSAQGERLGPDYVLRDHVLTRMLALPDGSLVIAVVPFQEHLFNAFRTALALDIIKLSPKGKEVYRTRIVGGEGAYAGKVWHMYSASSTVRMAWNGKSLGVFTAVSRNFGKPGAPDTHQGDLFVVLDEHGAILEDRTKLWSASHSNRLQMTTGPAGEMLTLTVGDAYPFGIYYINRDAKKNAIIWPEPEQRTPEIQKAIRTTTGAGTLRGFVRSGDKLFATIDAAHTLPNPDRKTHGDVLLVRFALDGTVEKKSWITNTSDRRERCPTIAPYREGFLVAWSDARSRDDSRAVLAVVDANGDVVLAPKEVPDAQRHTHSSEVVALPGGGVAWLATTYRGSSIDLFTTAP